MEKIERWSANYIASATSFITIDGTRLYTMIPQERGVTVIKQLIEASGLKQIDSLRKEIILRCNGILTHPENRNYIHFFVERTIFK